MNMKKVLVVAALAAMSFGISLAVSMTRSRPGGAAAAHEANTPTTMPEVLTAGITGDMKLAPKESQLDELIREVRQKLLECHQRETSLDERESRLEIAQELLKKQVKDLENLRVALVAPLNSLKEEQDKLDKSRVKILQEERANLKKLATSYDKMDAASGSRILSGMCEGQQEDDAARILYYMADRSAAKVLSEIQDKALAARLMDRLKKIREEG